MIKLTSHPQNELTKDKNFAYQVSSNRGREAYQDRKLYFYPSKHKEFFRLLDVWIIILIYGIANNKTILCHSLDNRNTNPNKTADITDQECTPISSHITKTVQLINNMDYFMEPTSIKASLPAIFLLPGSKFKLNNKGQNKINTSFCIDSDNIQNISFSLDKEYDTNLMIIVQQNISSKLPSYSKTDITII